MVEWCTLNLCRNGSISRGTSHATTTERYQYTASMDINNTRCERIQSLIQNHMQRVRIESAREQRTALYKSYEQDVASSSASRSGKRGSFPRPVVEQTQPGCEPGAGPRVTAGGTLSAFLTPAEQSPHHAPLPLEAAWQHGPGQRTVVGPCHRTEDCGGRCHRTEDCGGPCHRTEDWRPMPQDRRLWWPMPQERGLWWPIPQDGGLAAHATGRRTGGPYRRTEDWWPMPQDRGLCGPCRRTQDWWTMPQDTGLWWPMPQDTGLAAHATGHRTGGPCHRTEDWRPMPQDRGL